MSLPPPIKPTRVEVVGIHPQYARLLIIEVELDQLPPPRWVTFFGQVGRELPWLDMHPPVVQGSKIILNPTDADIEHEVAHTEERIILANQRWLSALAAERPAAATSEVGADFFSADVRDRIAAAKSRTRMMSEAFTAQGFWRSDAWVTEDLMSLEGVTRN